MSRLGNAIGRSSRNFESQLDSRRYFGIVTAEVTNITHEEGLYRAKVTYHSFHEDQESAWCRICTASAGGGRGIYIMPELGDEVVIGFLDGDEKSPVILGSLWNGSNATIRDNNGDFGGDNHSRAWITRSGHEMEFYDEDGKTYFKLTTAEGHVLHINDTDPEAFIHIIDKSEMNFIKINTDNTQIDMEVDSGGVINIKAPDGTINIECKDINFTIDNDWTAEVSNNYTLDVTSEIKVDSGGDTNITAGGNINETGSKINMNC